MYITQIDIILYTYIMARNLFVKVEEPKIDPLCYCHTWLLPW